MQLLGGLRCHSLLWHTGVIEIRRYIRLGRAHRRQLVRGLPFRNKLDAGHEAAYGAKYCESGLSAVSLRLCGPLALIPVNEQNKRNLVAKFGPKMATVHAPCVAGRRYQKIKDAF